METLDYCPFCKSKKIVHKFSCFDYLVTNEKFGIYECCQCGLMFTNPRPEEDEINNYYKSDDYVVHTENKTNFINSLFLIVREISIRKKYRIIKKYNVNNRILDIGCGTGKFLSFCKSKGMETTGVEPSELAREIAKEKYKLNNIHSPENLNSFPGNHYGIITLWHVLEHVHNIGDYLEKIYFLLVEEGILLIALPNPESYDARYYSNYWAAYDVPRHLYHFKKDVILTVMEKYNFKILNILPMKFDSYYISMLSEKNINGRIKFIKSLFIGMLSNLKAFGKNNYSSLIYIFKKV